jgi:sugar phosphate isomerase/epimerase
VDLYNKNKLVLLHQNELQYFITKPQGNHHPTDWVHNKTPAKTLIKKANCSLTIPILSDTFHAALMKF